MTSTYQSVNYQDTDLEGDSTRNILDIRAFLLLLFLCIYFKFCSYFMFILLGGWGLGFHMVFSSAAFH